MTLLLQISDAHFGTEQAAVAEALVRLAAALRPDVAVWSGDITQRAYRRQFDAARRFADRLGVPHTLAIPGNHDLPLFDLMARLRRPYANYRRAFGHELEPRFESQDMLVLGVNTTRPWRHQHGEVSHRQIERVARQLQAADARQLRIVVVHHPVALIEASDRTNLLRGRGVAIARWADAGADLILGGHIHLPYVTELDLERASAHRVWTAQAGTALSSRVRGDFPNSVNLVRHCAASGAASTVERWDFNAGLGAFHAVKRTEIKFGSAPGLQ